ARSRSWWRWRRGRAPPSASRGARGRARPHRRARSRAREAPSRGRPGTRHPPADSGHRGDRAEHDARDRHLRRPEGQIEAIGAVEAYEGGDAADARRSEREREHPPGDEPRRQGRNDQEAEGDERPAVITPREIVTP